MSHARPLHYLDVLRAAQANARGVDAARAAAYYLLPQGTSCKMDWQGSCEPWYHATPRQQALLDVLQDLLDGGETEVPRLALKAALRLRCREADILRSRDNIDDGGRSGYFFDDILHALFLLDVQQTEDVFNGLVDRLVQPASIRRRWPVR